MSSRLLWDRYKRLFRSYPSIGLALDITRMDLPDDFLLRLDPAMQNAFQAMQELEAGSIANPDENRMVGHYWLRSPERAPRPEIRDEITRAFQSIKDFVFAVHAGKIAPRKRGRFSRLLCVGIGGSALGPQLLSEALGTPADVMKLFFLDNTDPDGIDRVLDSLQPHLDDTLTIVLSKSGGTIETRNGMIEVMHAYRNAGLIFERHAAAVTGAGSLLHATAKRDGWLAVFPLWDWIGGRTSLFSPVGLLPAALQGIYMEELLRGAAACDDLTRLRDTLQNPAALLALSWYHAGEGQGKKDMVILPYKDRLQLFPRYLQQLIMESLGKEKDLDGNIVNQGMTVYGNKGSTDQHAYVQQLRDGLNNFFATFIEVLKDRGRPSPEVAPGITSGDYLSAFLDGTRNALYENGRRSITLTIEQLDARCLGALIALYERAVGLYASLINVNAYHQPGVEAGKKMADAVIQLQVRVIEHLGKSRPNAYTAEEIADAIGANDQVESVFRILQHASASGDHGIIRTAGSDALSARFASSRVNR